MAGKWPGTTAEKCDEGFPGWALMGSGQGSPVLSVAALCAHILKRHRKLFVINAPADSNTIDRLCRLMLLDPSNTMTWRILKRRLHSGLLVERCDMMDFGIGLRVVGVVAMIKHLGLDDRIFAATVFFSALLRRSDDVGRLQWVSGLEHALLETPFYDAVDDVQRTLRTWADVPDAAPELKSRADTFDEMVRAARDVMLRGVCRDFLSNPGGNLNMLTATNTLCLLFAAHRLGRSRQDIIETGLLILRMTFTARGKLVHPFATPTAAFGLPSAAHVFSTAPLAHLPIELPYLVSSGADATWATCSVRTHVIRRVFGHCPAAVSGALAMTPFIEWESLLVVPGQHSGEPATPLLELWLDLLSTKRRETAPGVGRKPRHWLQNSTRRTQYHVLRHAVSVERYLLRTRLMRGALGKRTCGDVVDRVLGYHFGEFSVAKDFFRRRFRWPGELGNAGTT